MKQLTITIAFAAVLASTAPAQGLSASAYLTFAQNGSVWNYDIHLTDTGTTNVGTFWYSWVPGQGFLPTPPTNLGNPSGWGAGSLTDGNKSIQWIATTPLTPGQTLDGFTFTSSDSPTVLAGMSNGFAIGTSFVYIGQPFGDSGFKLVANPVPEPASLAVVGLGAVAMFRRRTSRKS